jgi:ADP-L-glycero-D-manno-heptose 6-epimerase
MIIVTGGAGFIGSALIAGLNTRGINDIIVVDQLGTDQKWKNLRNLRYADYYEKDDFLQMVIQNQLPSQVKTVFHLGANSSTTETDASFLVKNNYEYTKILCQWAINSDVRFIYASSASTYGNGELGFSDNEDEIHNLQPLNMYG